MDIPHEQKFHFSDGTSVGDLEQLKEKIESISYDEFYGHVNEEKNDFAAWVEGVLKETEVAERLKAVNSIVETVEILNEALFPEEVQHAETKLKEEGMKDFQERIEEQLFTDVPLAEPMTEPNASPSEELPAVEEIPEDSSDMLPEREPLPEERLVGSENPREPVTTTEPAHKPITEMVSKPEPADHHFPVNQFLLGIVFGIIIGLLIAKVIRGF